MSSFVLFVFGSRDFELVLSKPCVLMYNDWHRGDLTIRNSVLLWSKSRSNPENTLTVFDLEDQCLIYGEEVMFLYCHFNFQICVLVNFSIPVWSLLLSCLSSFSISLLSCSMNWHLFILNVHLQTRRHKCRFHSRICIGSENNIRTFTAFSHWSFCYVNGAIRLFLKWLFIFAFSLGSSLTNPIHSGICIRSDKIIEVFTWVSNCFWSLLTTCSVAFSITCVAQAKRLLRVFLGRCILRLIQVYPGKYDTRKTRALTNKALWRQMVEQRINSEV